MLAIFFAFLGAVFNYVYLLKKLPQVDTVAFVGIRDDVDLAQGDVLTEQHVTRVEIPSRYAGSLIDFAVPDSARSGALGRRVWRDLEGGSLLLRQDLRTPPDELDLGPDEGMVWIPVNTQAMVASLIKPGDLVSFLVSRSRVGAPTPAGDIGPNPPGEDPPSSGPIDTVGPFQILSLGNRLGSADVFKSARRPLMQENVVGILVRLGPGGEPDERVQKLLNLLDATNNRPVGVMLHGRDTNRG
jgi:hypothetical protein